MKHRPKPKGSIIAALDIGTTKIACFIARVVDDEGHFEILGIGHQASAGMKAGTIIDLAAAEAAIRTTVHAAEQMASEAIKGYPLREVIINVPGVHAQSHNYGIDVSTMGHEITDNDVRRALIRAQDQAVAFERELIHSIPASHSIDGHGGIREPRGMFGQNLSVDIHLVTGDTSAIRNMTSCIERSHLDIQSMCVSSYAAGLACLVEDEMDLGCTVIDMGGGVTSMAVFSGGALIHTDAIPVGGQHVTNDIARGLMTGFADAERLKTLYGSAMAATTDDSELIDIPQLGESNRNTPNHEPRSVLIGVIQPRLEEIFEMVHARLKRSGLGPEMGRRVVLTGGASQMPGLRELGQLVLDKQVRVGRPIHMAHLPDAVSGPAFATTAGLLKYYSEHSDEMPSVVRASFDTDTIMNRVRGWLRKNW
jgi:cell division protein FtsA